jgi:predicted NAD/FAD-dependent oxidoreductase
MNELGKMLCRDLDVIKECRIHLLVPDNGGWRLELADENHLAACGDWCIEDRVEAAILSARGLTRN